MRAAVEAASFEEGLRKEGEIFLELSKGAQAAALQHVFFAERQMSKVKGASASWASPTSTRSATAATIWVVAATQARRRC